MMYVKFFIVVLMVTITSHTATADGCGETYLAAIDLKINELKISKQFHSELCVAMGETAQQKIPSEHKEDFLKSLNLFMNVNVPVIEKEPRPVAYALAFFIDESIKRNQDPAQSHDNYGTFVDMIAEYIKSRMTEGMESKTDQELIDLIDKKIRNFKQHLRWRIGSYQNDYLCPAYRDESALETMSRTKPGISRFQFCVYNDKVRNNEIQKKQFLMSANQSLQVVEEILLSQILIRQTQDKVRNTKWGPMSVRAMSYDTRKVPKELRRNQWPVIIMLEPFKFEPEADSKPTSTQAVSIN